MREWTPLGLDAAIKKGEKLCLVDVREPDEFAICRIEGAELIPLGEMEERSGEVLSSAEPVVLYCHHGVRSEMAMKYLSQQGLQNVGHLVGGIDAWAEQIDPNMVRY